MNIKVLIKATRKSNLLDAITNYLDTEKITYEVENSLAKLQNVTNIIYIDDEEPKEIGKKIKAIPVIFIGNQKRIIPQISNINYMITQLVTDDQNYTEVQKEYLFKKGIYHIFLQKVQELLENKEHYNGLIYDFTEIKMAPDNWIFHFSSITDTYRWLSKKNQSLPVHFPRKVINFYSDKVYDDSLREINYLTEKITEIKEKKRIIDIFICTSSELHLFLKNYFFKLLVQNISKTYQLYFIDKNQLLEQEQELIEKLYDGIAIYDDCIYRDTYDDEFSLGFVDCKKEVIEEYNHIFDYILEKYGHPIQTKEDLDEF